MHSSGRQSMIPVSAYKREQAGISRRKLYPVTAFYTAFAVIHSGKYSKNSVGGFVLFVSFGERLSGVLPRRYRGY